MNENNKKILISVCILGTIMLLAVVGYCKYTDSRVKSDDYHLHDAMERTEEHVDRAADRLESAQEQVNNAQDELNRAADTAQRVDDGIREASESADRNTAGLDECLEIVNRMQGRAGRIESILDSVEKGSAEDGA